MPHHHHKEKSKVSWIDRDFHAFCVIIYVVICTFDFLLFPLYFEYQNSALTPDHQAAIAETFKDGPSQVQVFIALRQEKYWHPITLESSGLFHVAFGAILGVGIWARGKTSLNNNNDPTTSLQTMVTGGGSSPTAATMAVTSSTVMTQTPTPPSSSITPPSTT